MIRLGHRLDLLIIGHKHEVVLFGSDTFHVEIKQKLVVSYLAGFWLDLKLKKEIRLLSGTFFINLYKMILIK